jgi:hypothetical protein
VAFHHRANGNAVRIKCEGWFHGRSSHSAADLITLRNSKKVAMQSQNPDAKYTEKAASTAFLQHQQPL